MTGARPKGTRAATFTGKPCRKDGSTERYESSGQCVRCARQRPEAARAAQGPGAHVHSGGADVSQVRSPELLALYELMVEREAYRQRFERAKVQGSRITRPHEPGCVVYRAAPLLLGFDRRGMCTCGAEAFGVAA